MPKKKKPLLGLEKKSNTMWIGMIVFFSVWMFVLGIFVGRGTAPVKFDIEKLQKELVALKETVLKEQRERFKTFMETAQKKTDLDFYEDLKAPDTPDTSAKNLVRTTPAKKASVPAKKPVPAPSTGAKGKDLTIQISSLKDAAMADALVAKLKQQGYPAYRARGDIPGKGIWYRVRVGHFRNKAESEPMMKQMKKDKYKPYLVKQQ